MPNVAPLLRGQNRRRADPGLREAWSHRPAPSPINRGGPDLGITAYFDGALGPVPRPLPRPWRLVRPTIPPSRPPVDSGIDLADLADPRRRCPSAWPCSPVTAPPVFTLPGPDVHTSFAGWPQPPTWSTPRGCSAHLTYTKLQRRAIVWLARRTDRPVDHWGAVGARGRSARRLGLVGVGFGLMVDQTAPLGGSSRRLGKIAVLAFRQR